MRENFKIGAIYGMIKENAERVKRTLEENSKQTEDFKKHMKKISEEYTIGYIHGRLDEKRERIKRLLSRSKRKDNLNFKI